MTRIKLTDEERRRRHSEVTRLWRERNRERYNETSRLWRERNRERYNETSRLWRERNPERARETSRRCRERNREQNRVQKQRYTEQNKERVIASQRNWRQNHKDRIRIKDARRHAKKRALPATFAEADWTRALEYWHGACAYCGQPPRLWDDPRVLHQDHYVPLSAGGPYTPDNIVPACPSCNFSKSSNDPLEWLARTQGRRQARKTVAAIQAYFAWIQADKESE